MLELGFDAVNHDLSDGPGPLATLGPFDLIIAGELIEHVPDLTMLFKAAHHLLSKDGELILTTPNPYAPSRVIAGQRGDFYENVDHIMYAFPSGIAELAERTGMVLVEAATTQYGRRTTRTAQSMARRAKRWLRGTSWITVGVTTHGDPKPIRITNGATAVRRLNSRPARFLGETFVYVLRLRADGAI